MLNDKQLRFCAEFCISHSAADAARKAGYSVKTAGAIGHENLKKPEIQAAIQARQQVVALELRVTLQGVLSDLLEAVQIAREQRNPAAMIAGVREVAKILGYYSPEVQKVEFSFDGRGMAAKYAAMSDEALMAIIEGRPFS